MRPAEIAISQRLLASLASAKGMKGAAVTRAHELAALLTADAVALTATPIRTGQVQGVYARRLRIQQKRGRTVTAGLPELVCELMKLTTEYVWVAAYELGSTAGHIFIAGDPARLVGITTALRRFLT